MRWLKRGGSKQTQLHDIGNRESPCPVWKATGVSQIACLVICACFGCCWPPFFIDPTVNGVNYLNMLQTYAIPAISDIPCLVFQQDRAPPHWSRHVRAYLDATLRNAWIGRGGPTAWPARCPDLTPLDFFFWVKDRVYNTAVNEIDHLKEISKRMWDLWLLTWLQRPGGNFVNV